MPDTKEQCCSVALALGQEMATAVSSRSLCRATSCRTVRRSLSTGSGSLWHPPGRLLLGSVHLWRDLPTCTGLSGGTTTYPRARNRMQGERGPRPPGRPSRSPQFELGTRWGQAASRLCCPPSAMWIGRRESDLSGRAPAPANASKRTEPGWAASAAPASPEHELVLADCTPQPAS